MKLSEFLKDIKEASYLVHVNEGNNFFIKGGHGDVIVDGNTAIIGDISVSADMECVVDDPAWQSVMQSGFDKYYRTGRFEIGNIMVEVTYTFVSSNKCQCAHCNA